MKQFLQKVGMFAGVSALLILGLLYYYHRTQIDSIDPFYRRFTTGRQPSLLLGSSRAAQGLRPDVFDRELGAHFTAPFFNFSFTVGSSNMGPNYLQKIKTRVKPSPSGLFVLCVDPWSMKQPKGQSETVYDEDQTFFAKQRTQGMSPNIEYLLLRDKKNQPFFQKLFLPKPSIYELHENGWLQVNYDVPEQEAADNSKWQIHLYTQDTLTFELAEKRFAALEKMLHYLDSVGTVVLVRLPTGSDMMKLEMSAFPNFDARIEAVATACNVPYINLISESGTYRTVDGNHIYKTETERLSKRICDAIQGMK